MLPKGFTSRILAVTGSLVEGTTYPWHPAPDGGAVFPQDDGGWVYTSNSEIPVGGGAGALRFGPDGEVVDAYRILTGTNQNCAGRPDPVGHLAVLRGEPRSARCTSARWPRRPRAS
jgi:hypothetical protein